MSQTSPVLTWNAGFAPTSIGITYRIFGDVSGAVLHKIEGGVTWKAFFKTADQAKATAEADYRLQKARA